MTSESVVYLIIAVLLTGFWILAYRTGYMIPMISAVFLISVPYALYNRFVKANV